MKVNGKSKTPITAAQAKKKDGESGGTKARTSQQTSKKKLNGVKTAVLERISDGILAFDAGMNYTYLNERAGEMLGRSAEDLIGKNLEEEYSGAGRTPFMEACQRALETQSVVWLNEYFPATDRWLEGRVYPSEDGVSVLFTEGSGQRTMEEDRYRVLVESMQEAFFLADVLTDEQGQPQDYRFVDVNAAMEQLLGKSRTQILGQAIRELLPLTDRDINLVRRIAAVGLGGEPFFIDEYSESMQRWFRSHFFSPQPGQVSGMSLDITASRQAEDRNREISMFPEQNPNPVMRLTREGGILYANQASGFLLTAWEEEQYQTESFLKIREQLQETLETGSNQQIEIENQGRVFNCLVVPIAANGYVNVYFQDITERKLAEETLRAIVNQASAGIVRTDPQAGFTFVNQAICDMLGYSEAELTRLSIWDVTDREILEKNRRLFEHMLATGEGYQLENRLIRRDGSMFWVNMGTSALRDADGRIRGATSIIVDISRRKRAEESLLDGARRSLFLSSLSDTIRSIENPLKIQVEAACLVGAHLKASRVAYVNVDSEDRFLVLDHYVDGVPEMEGEFSVSDFVPQDQLPKFRAGRLFSTSNVKKDARFHDSHRSKLMDLSIQAQMILPFAREGRVVAALLIQQSQTRAWKDAEVSLVEEAAERMQAAIERAQVEGRLHDSEKRFRILANAVPSIVWTSTPDGRLLFVNDRWYDFTGMHDQGNAPVWRDLKLHPEDAPDFFREMRDIKNSQSEAVTEVRMQRQDGVYRWFQIRSVPTKDENGMITAWHGVLTDIHDRVEKEAEHRKIIDSTPFMLTRCSRDLRYLFVSRAYAEMIGRTPEQLIGVPIVEVMGEKGLETIQPYVDQVLQGQRVEFETRVSFKDFNTPLLHVVYTPDRDEQGNIAGWFASIVDLTERRRMEESLREGERKFNIIFNKLPFTAVLLRPEDNIIVDINEEFETVFGYTRQEAIGKTTSALGIDSNPQDRAHILADLQANVAIRDMELQFFTKQQGLRTFLINTDMVTIGGNSYVLQTAQDITERREVEKALARERELLDRLFKSIPVMLTIYDPLTGKQQINSYFERLTGLKNEGLTPRTLVEVCYPDPEYRQEVIQKMVSSADNEWLDIRMWTLNGHTLDTAWSKIAFPDGTQVGLGIDITDRKRAEAAIRASEEKYRRIVETANEGIWEIDRDARTVFVNARMAEMLGHTVEEMIGRSSFEFIFPEDQPDGEKRMARARGGTPARSNTFKFRRKDGSVLWALVSSSPQLDEQGNFIGSTAMIMDITERRQAEEALRTSEERMRLAIESNRMVAWEWDPQADRVTTSDNFSEIYGLTTVSSEADGFSLIWPEDLPAHRARVDQVMIQGGEYRSEFRITRPQDGLTVWLEERAIALTDDNNGLVTRLVGVVIDITERKRAEQELAEFARQQGALYKLADELSSAGSLEEMFNPALDAILSALQCDRASILLFDKQDVMSFVAWRGLSAEYRQATNGHTPWTRAERNARPIGMEDVATADLSDSLRAVIQAEGIGALAFIPLISRGNLIGKFMVYFNKPHIFEEAEIGLAQTIAHQLASHIERKRAAEELRQSQQRLSLTYHHAPIGIVETALDGRFLEVNDELCRMLGYTYDELSRLGIADVTHPDYHERERELYQQMVDGTIPTYRMEKQFIKKDGGLLWGEVVRTMVHDENGRPLYGIGGVLNVTERKQREEEIRARTEEIEALMEVSPIGIFFAYDPECSFITANPAGYHLVEMPEESTGNASKSAPEQERPTYRVFRNGLELKPEELPMQTAARLGMEIEEETLELRFENGMQKYIYSYAKPLFDARGKTRGAIAAMLDVTERRRSEQALRASEERFSKAFRVSPDAVTISRLSDGHIIEVNNSWSTVFGYDPEEAVGKTSLDLNLFPNPEERNKVVNLLKQQGYVRDYEVDVRRKSGEIRHALLAVERIEINGVECLISIMRDVTERKRSEETLRQSEERFARFMLHLPGLAWIKDIQGHYVFANAEAQKAFNASQEELYGKTDGEIFPPEIAVQFNRNDDLAVLEEKGIQVVETLPQEDGVVHHSLVTKFPIPGPDGRPNMIGGTAFDITERIQMEEALQLARTQAEKTAYRVTQLQKITAALSQAVTTSEIAQMVVEQGAPVVGAMGSSILLVNDESQTMEMMYSSMDEAVVRPFVRFPLALNVPASDAVRSGQPVWIASQEEYIQRYPHLVDNIKSWGLEAALVFPMIYKGRVLGALSLSFSQTRPFSVEDQEYLLTLARQAAQAIERARVETALRLDAALMENVPAGIYLVRAKTGIILHTNPQLDKLFGYEPGEVIGKPVSILNASNGHSTQEVADGIIEILNQKGSWQGEVLSIRKDGTEFWCSASITTFEHDTYGTVWVAARQDITERKQIEEALRESEQRSSAIVSQATAGIVRKDESGRLLFVNQAFCDMLGMSEAELKGRHIWELTHPEDVSENKRLYNRLMAEGIPFHLEKRLIDKQGSILWVNVSVSPVVDVSGKPNSAVSVYVDITGRKLAEKRLSLLVRVSELAREFEDPDELMYAVAQAVGEHFQARRTLFNEIDLENNLEIIHRDYCIGVESVAGEHPITGYSGITTAEMIAGKTVVNRDSKLDPRTAADYERSYVEHGERAYVTVPLMQDGRWVASLWLSDDKPRDWDREDVSLVETIAERTWIAIEKMRVDRALRDSEERLRVTFNTTVLGFATLTPENNFVDVNDAYCRIVGYSRQELLKLNSDSLTHPDFIEETRRHVAQLLAGEVPDFTLEKIYIRRDGTEIWVQNSVSIVRDENGDPLHLIAICQDITDRKRSERALQESNQRYQTLVEISPYAIFVNKDGRIVFANNECVRLLGAESLEQVIGRSNFDFLHPDYHDIVRERNRLLMLGHQDVPSLEEKIIRFDGEIVDVEISASPFIEQGEPAILVTMNNITERKRAEEALHQLNLELEERVKRRTTELQVANEFLRESEATSRLILESMPDAIVIIDRDGQIVHANTQVETLFGYAPGEVMGQPVETLVPQRLRTEHEQQRASYAEERNRRIMGLGHELFGRRKDESEFPVEVMLAPIDNSTNWDVLVAIRDNTRQRQAQEALRINEEKLRTLFEILPVGISFLGKDGRVNELNSALAEILGLPRRDIQAGSFRARRFIRADGSPMPASEFASTRARVEQKTIYNVETGIVKDDGEIIWTSVNAAPVQIADVEAAIVTIDITERKKAEEALHRNRERLRILSRRLVEVQEEERHAIARELHDRVGQNLAALTLNLNILRNQLSGEILDKVGARLNDSVTLVNDILTITRSVMADLRPNVLDDYGLDAAINEYAERFTQRYGIRVITHTPVKATPRLDPGVEMTLLRIAQEALTNIAKHAQASQAVMTLEMEDDAVLMTIEDNGQGIMSWQKVNQPGSHGLRIMRERAEAFGGSLKIHSTYKNGTKIEVKIPLASSVPTNGRKERK